MVKIAVFVSGGGTNLQSLIDAVKENYINGEIALVISSKESAYGLERARLAGIKAEFIKDEDLIPYIQSNNLHLTKSLIAYERNKIESLYT